jgi:hypothetical protein
MPERGKPLAGHPRPVLAGAVLGAVLVVGDAKAEFFTGEQLREICESPSSAGQSWQCVGYVEAIADVMGHAMYEGWRACIPTDERVTGAQAADVVTKYLRAHPDWLRFTASDLVARALAEAFPCPR